MSLEERLELDIGDALRGIDSIESALGSAAASFQSALTDALDVLAHVTVGEVDASPVTSAIDEAVTAADVVPVIEADASSVTSTLDTAIAAADNIVTVDADTTAMVTDITKAAENADAVVTPNADMTSAVAQIEDAAASTTATVTVEADTSAAEAAISDLGASADASSGGVESLSSGVSGLSAVSAVASGNVAGLSEGAKLLGPEGEAGAAGVAALGGTVAEFFKTALDADTATHRFNTTLGEFAGDVSHVNVGGLNEDLSQLALRTGNSDTAILNASANIFQLGTSAGVAGPQVAETTKQIDALAIRAATANPALGDAGAAADQLTSALARGGRALVPFGISLSSAEINARALADTGKATAGELTTYDKAAAGAALSTEKLGNALGGDINTNAQTAENQFRSLKVEFSAAIAQIGAPLVSPVLDLIRAAEPDAVQLGTTIGHLAEAVLPGLTKSLQTLEVPLEAVNSLIDLQSSLFGKLDEIIPGAGSTLSGAFSDALNPLALVGDAVDKGKELFGELTGNTDKSAAATKADEAAVKSLTTAFEDLNTPITKSLDSFIQQEIKAKDLTATLGKLGLTYDQLATFASHGKAGVTELDTALKANGAKVSADDLSKLRESVRGAGEDFQKSAQNALNEAVAQGQVSQAARDNAVSHHALADGHRDYLGALNELLPVQADGTRATKDATSAANDQAKATRDLENALNDLLTVEEAAVDKSLAFAVAQTRAKEANLAYGDAIAEQIKKQHDATTSAEDLEKAQLKVDAAAQAVTKSALDVAAAHDAADAATAKLSGTTETAEQKTRNLVQAFADQAKGLAQDSPLRTGLADYLSQILGLPPDKTTQLIADPSQANAAIDALNLKLDQLAARNVAPKIAAAIGNVLPFMAGGPIGAGETGFVGEVEPEIFVPRQSGVIGNQAQLQAAFSTEIARQLGQLKVSGKTGSNITNNIFEVATDPRATANALAFRLGEAVPR